MMHDCLGEMIIKCSVAILFYSIFSWCFASFQMISPPKPVICFLSDTLYIYCRCKVCFVYGNAHDSAAASKSYCQVSCSASCIKCVCNYPAYFCCCCPIRLSSGLRNNRKHLGVFAVWLCRLWTIHRTGTSLSSRHISQIY